MSRVKISEFRAKTLLSDVLGNTYTGFEVDLENYINRDVNSMLKPTEMYVVKVDQAIKKRNKLGLVFVKVPARLVVGKLEKIKKLGYRWALVEPYIEHDQSDEMYLSIELTKTGLRVLYSNSGGVDIEEKPNEIQLIDIEYGGTVDARLSWSKEFQKICTLFHDAHMTNLEINPFLFRSDRLIPLDAAVQVDDAAQFLVRSAWSHSDFRVPKKSTHKSEIAVERLASKSSSSLSLKVLNENGSIFMLLSGGGASVVISDELANAKLQDEVANYGEYSGNPSEEDTYLYAKQILELLLRSKAQRKILIIAGGVANFTDVSTTFMGIIRAIDDVKSELKNQQLSIVVRRGGPREAIGLRAMKSYLDSQALKNVVYGSSYSLADVIPEVKKGLNL